MEEEINNFMFWFYLHQKSVLITFRIMFLDLLGLHRHILR